MAKIVQTRRGNTEQHKGFDGQQGEITVDLTENTIRVHDGSAFPAEQPSGYPLARSDMTNVANVVGIIQLKLSDGTPGQVIATDGSDTIAFSSSPDVSGSIISGDLSGTIGNAQIIPQVVGTTELTDLNVTRIKIAADAVDNTKLADDAVQTENIVNANVTTIKIADYNVTRAKLEVDAVDNSKLADNAVQTENIVNLNVTREKIAADAIDNSKLADNAVQTENIVDGAITDDKIDTIQGLKLTGPLPPIDGSAITGLPYDISFLAGWDSETLPTDLLIQSYAEMIMGRTGVFDGEIGVIEVASSGASVICDIELNGTSIYFTKPVFAAGTGLFSAGVLTTTGFVSGDKLTFRVLQIGTDPDFGFGVRLMLKCRV
tara:strand:+ start:1590 stop:2714 length:1125 start_codon:yes stop_codon:yes gene_type:complete